jgi:outer membrane receptor protein involved in Fe transport
MHPVTTPARGLLALGHLLLSTAFASIAAAQVAPANSATSATTSAPIQLSPFEVTSDKDVGYQAGNTASGSRFNTSLKDTAAAVMVFTPEFLADFGTNSLADIVGYAPNMQVDMLDTAADANPQFLGGSDLRDTRIRVRGLSASTAQDFFETGIAIDTYNTERLELSGGPNSILFGFGSPGGLVNVMTKRAQVQRNRSAFRTQIGQWAYSRFELDHNQVIIPGKLALRLNGLQQNGKGWRTYEFSDIDRGAISVRANPWPQTTLIANYENGQLKSQVSRPINAYDSLALWQARGSGTKSDAAWVAADRALGINRNTSVRNFYITDADGSAPFVLLTSNANNLRLLDSTSEDFNIPAADRVGLTMVPAAQIPFNVNTYGPGSARDTNFDRFLGTLEHRFANNVTVELAYNSERAKQALKTVTANLVVLGGDPNTVIPNPNGTATTVPNPNVGQLYLETRWVGDTGKSGNDVLRGSVAWDLNLGKFGRHKLAGLAEHGRLRSFRYPQVEILVDERGVPIGLPATPENAQNFLFRRHYVSPGKFDTYFTGNAEEPVSFTRNGHTYHNTLVNSSVAGGDIRRTMNTVLGATQSSFFDGKVVLTAGVRWDRITFDQFGDTRLSASDPDVLAGRAIQNTVHFNREIEDTTRFKPVTSTLGAVWHATRLVSVFYNHANNNSQPPLNARVLPDETLPPPFDGMSDDYGFMLNLLDGKIFLRATAFKTSQKKSTGGTFVIGLNAGDNNLVAPSTRILDALLAANRITAAEYTQHLIGDEANLTGSSDIVNNGYELSTWFNVTKNLTAIVNFSYTETDRSSIVPEFEGWFERENTFWHRTAGAGSLVTSGASTIDQEAQLLKNIMQGVRDFYGFGYGERPYKVNASGRYSVGEGRLRGVFVGGGVRWQSESKLGRALLGRAANGNRILGETYYGPEDFKMDAFIGYRCKLSWRKTSPELTLQLNATNLTNEDEVMPLRYNPNKSGYLRVLLFEPRRLRFTASLAF